MTNPSSPALDAAIDSAIREKHAKDEADRAVNERGPYLATWYSGTELVTLNTGASATRKTIKVFRTREAAQAALDSWLAPLKREFVHTPRVMSLAQFRVEATDYSEYVAVWAHSKRPYHFGPRAKHSRKEIA